MNTGIQDGYNLAWKMALVLRGKVHETLLETYNEERLENAKNLTQSTDRMFQFLASSEWFLAFLRTNVLPSIAKYILASTRLKTYFSLISQMELTIDKFLSHMRAMKLYSEAGDRMPYPGDGQSFMTDCMPPISLARFLAEQNNTNH